MINSCKCGAKSRTNYPYGKKSKGRTRIVIPHDEDCHFNEENFKNFKRIRNKKI